MFHVKHMKGSNFIMNRKAFNPFVVNPLQRTLVYCQNVLPLAFDNSMSYYEFLCAMNCKVNEIIKVINNQNLTMVEFQKLVSQEVEVFEKYVNDNFSELTTNFNEFKAALLADFETFKNQIESEQDTFESNINAAWTAYRNSINQSFSEFSAAITQMQNEVAAQNSAISTMQTTVAQCEQNVNTLSTSVENLVENQVGIVSPEGEQVEIDGNTYTYGEKAVSLNIPTDCHAIGNKSLTTGNQNNAIGNNSFASGSQNTATGVDSFVSGSGNKANGLRAVCFGMENESGNNQFSCGTFNDNTNSNLSFMVGNGTDASTRGNSFAVDRDGYLYSPEIPNGYKFEILTQAEYDLISVPDSRTIYIIVSGGSST